MPQISLVCRCMFSAHLPSGCNTECAGLRLGCPTDRPVVLNSVVVCKEPSGLVRNLLHAGGSVRQFSFKGSSFPDRTNTCQKCLCRAPLPRLCGQVFIRKWESLLRQSTGFPQNPDKSSRIRTIASASCSRPNLKRQGESGDNALVAALRRTQAVASPQAASPQAGGSLPKRFIAARPQATTKGSAPGRQSVEFY